VAAFCGRRHFFCNGRLSAFSAICYQSITAQRDRNKVWSGLPALCRGQVTRSATERVIYRKVAATSSPSVQKLNSLLHIDLPVAPLYPSADPPK